MASGSSSLILLGHVSAAHGIKGEVVIKSYAQVPEDVAAYGPVCDEGGERAWEILSVRSTNKGLIARIAGVADRTTAESLIGTGLYVSRGVLPVLQDNNEYYAADLIGLAAHDAKGVRIGEVVAVQNFGAGDLLEVRLIGQRQSEFVSFESRFVPVVDLDAGRVVVELPISTGEVDPESDL